METNKQHAPFGREVTMNKLETLEKQSLVLKKLEEKMEGCKKLREELERNLDAAEKELNEVTDQFREHLRNDPSPLAKEILAELEDV